MSQWTSLRNFNEWYLGGHFLMLSVPANPVKVSQGSFEFVLFRDGCYQAELICLYPNVPVPEHRHPNVSTIETHLCGSGDAWIGRRKMDETPLLTDPLMSNLRRIIIPAGVPHRGVAHENTVVVSCQRWREGHPPGFISDDWEGDPWK